MCATEAQASLDYISNQINGPFFLLFFSSRISIVFSSVRVAISRMAEKNKNLSLFQHLHIYCIHQIDHNVYMAACWKTPHTWEFSTYETTTQSGKTLTTSMISLVFLWVHQATVDFFLSPQRWLKRFHRSFWHATNEIGEKQQDEADGWLVRSKLPTISLFSSYFLNLILKARTSNLSAQSVYEDERLRYRRRDMHLFPNRIDATEIYTQCAFQPWDCYFESIKLIWCYIK